MGNHLINLISKDSKMIIFIWSLAIGALCSGIKVNQESSQELAAGKNVASPAENLSNKNNKLEETNALSHENRERRWFSMFKKAVRRFRPRKIMRRFRPRKVLRRFKPRKFGRKRSRKFGRKKFGRKRGRKFGRKKFGRRPSGRRFGGSRFGGLRRYTPTQNQWQQGFGMAGRLAGGMLGGYMNSRQQNPMAGGYQRFGGYGNNGYGNGGYGNNGYGNGGYGNGGY